jgi:hypothetical protein
MKISIFTQVCLIIVYTILVDIRFYIHQIETEFIREIVALVRFVAAGEATISGKMVTLSIEAKRNQQQRETKLW